MVGETEPRDGLVYTTTRTVYKGKNPNEAPLGVYNLNLINGMWYVDGRVPLVKDTGPTTERFVLLDPRDAQMLQPRR